MHFETWLTEIMKSIDPKRANPSWRGSVLGEDQSNDLDKEHYVMLAVRSAFPLPDTGTFTDLISAIDDAERNL